MSDSFRQFEARAERELSLLSALPDAAPSQDVVDRLRSTVRGEARALRQRALWRRVQRGAGAAAAVILLAVLLRWPAATTSVVPTATLPDDPDAFVADWVTAGDQSVDYLTALFEAPSESDLEWGDDYTIDEFFEQFDAALEQEV